MEGVAGTEVQAGSEVPDENGAPPAEDVPAPAPAAEEVDEAPAAKEMPAAEEVDEAPTPEDVPGAEEVEVAGARPTHRIVRVVSVDVVLPDQFPTVTLEDTEDRDDAEEPRRLAFRIGTAEGVALAHALAGTTAPRPLTHDLFTDSLGRYGVEVLAVRLTGRIGPTYLAELELVGPAGREVLSCRPSDGICLALRQRVHAPVLCDERLFTVVGDVLPDGG